MFSRQRRKVIKPIPKKQSFDSIFSDTNFNQIKEHGFNRVGVKSHKPLKRVVVHCENGNFAVIYVSEIESVELECNGKDFPVYSTVYLKSGNAVLFKMKDNEQLCELIDNVFVTARIEMAYQ